MGIQRKASRKYFLWPSGELASKFKGFALRSTPGRHVSLKRNPLLDVSCRIITGSWSREVFHPQNLHICALNPPTWVPRVPQKWIMCSSNSLQLQAMHCIHSQTHKPNIMVHYVTLFWSNELIIDAGQSLQKLKANQLCIFSQGYFTGIFQCCWRNLGSAHPLHFEVLIIDVLYCKPFMVCWSSDELSIQMSGSWRLHC